MYLTVGISLLWVTSAKAIEVSDLTVGVSLLRVAWWCVPYGPLWGFTGSLPFLLIIMILSTYVIPRPLLRRVYSTQNSGSSCLYLWSPSSPLKTGSHLDTVTILHVTYSCNFLSPIKAGLQVLPHFYMHSDPIYLCSPSSQLKVVYLYIQ